MKEFLIADLARIIKAEPTRNAGVFTGISTDSRTTRAGDCFFAIAGENFDGADFLAEAFAKGAACAVVGKKVADSSATGSGQRIAKKLKTQSSKLKTILRVDDSVKALGDFAREYRRRGNFKVVAITGSVGKTMTRQITYHVLSQHFRCYQAPKNFNNNIGLPLTLLGADAEDEIIVAELGSNHPGEIAKLSRIALPDIAVVTNVCPAHLAGFGNLETIIAEKLSISESLQAGGDFLINADIVNRESCPVNQTTSDEAIIFGKSDGCDIQAKNITVNGLGSRLTIDGVEIVLPLAKRKKSVKTSSTSGCVSRNVACISIFLGTITSSESRNAIYSPLAPRIPRLRACDGPWEADW